MLTFIDSKMPRKVDRRDDGDEDERGQRRRHVHERLQVVAEMAPPTSPATTPTSA